MAYINSQATDKRRGAVTPVSPPGAAPGARPGARPGPPPLLVLAAPVRHVADHAGRGEEAAPMGEPDQEVRLAEVKINNPKHRDNPLTCR